MNISELKKVSDGSIFITHTENMSYIYVYSGNNIVYIPYNLDSKIKTLGDIQITKTSTIKDLSTLIDVINSKNYEKDDEPFDFNFDIQITKSPFNVNIISNLVNSFNYFYKDDSLTPDYTGINFKGTKIFATNGNVIKLKNNSILPTDVNSVFDLKSISGCLDLDTKKIKKTNFGKGLFSNKKEEVSKLGIVNRNDDVMMYIYNEGLHYLSIPKSTSNLSFDKMKSFKKSNSFTFYKDNMYNVLKKYETLELNEDYLYQNDLSKDIVVLNCINNKLEISLYSYTKEHKIIGTLNVKTQNDFRITFDVNNLLLIIKNIKSDLINAHIDLDKKLLLIKEDNTDTTYFLIGTIL